MKEEEREIDNPTASVSVVEVAGEDDIDESSPAAQEPRPEDIIRQIEENRGYGDEVKSINDFPPYQPEEQNQQILIRGRWLERGGSAWWISTAGTGKSIASVQMAYCWGAGIPFAGLAPHRPLRTWVIQSEDSPSRITIDREDIVAELTEQIGTIDWPAIGKEMVKFVTPKTGIAGPAFFKKIGSLLDIARRRNEMPDVLLINPFMAFVGGPVSDGGYVTPFLRGGLIDGKPCEGLQPFLERYNVAAIIFHHTPKPPPEREVESWLKSAFPEYQGAGSSDITNWGRSFVTAMKMPKHPRILCLCAGKNGSEIGWEQIGGNYRRYLSWSDGTGVTGGGRHAWRELNEDERHDIIDGNKTDADVTVEQVCDMIATDIKTHGAARAVDFETRFSTFSNRSAIRSAKVRLFAEPSKWRLTVKQILVGRKWTNYIGLVNDIEKIASEHCKLADKVQKIADMREKALGAMSVSADELVENIERRKEKPVYEL